MLLIVLGFLSFTCSCFWIALYLQRVLVLSPLKTGLYLIPQAISGLIVNLIAAFALSRVDNRILMFLGSISYVLCTVLFALMSSTSSYWAFIFPGLIISVVGADLHYNVANMYVLSSMDKELQSTAGGVFNTVLQLGTGIGLGITTAVWNSVTGEKGEVRSGVADAVELEMMERGYRAVFWTLCGFAGLSIVGQWSLDLGRQGHMKMAESTSIAEAGEVGRGKCVG